MRIAIIGAGYVGLVSGTCFSEFGVDVTCVDISEERVSNLQKGIIPIFEPGLDTMVKRNVDAGRLHFTTNLADIIPQADAVFIAVGTPSRRGDGHADLKYVYQAAEDVAKHLSGYTVIVTKSTVPVGTGREVKSIVAKTNPDADFDVASNPEFLREGAAIQDFMRPDRVVIGAETERALNVMRKLYQPLYRIEVPIVATSLETAELTKYAANAFLATKITFINEIADLCEKVGANVQDVARGIGLDGRIGKNFLHAGPGYGGSCFPKDTRALVRTAQDYNSPISIVESVVAVNDARPAKMAEKIMAACGGSVKGKKIALLGLTFKPNTDDMRESPSLYIVPELLKNGATIAAFDPKGAEHAKTLLPDITYAADPYETMQDADAVVILTEWNEFRALQLDRVKDLLKTPIMVDLRNVYKPEEMSEAGFTYVSVGR